MACKPVTQNVFCESNDRVAMHVRLITISAFSVHPCERKLRKRGQEWHRAFSLTRRSSRTHVSYYALFKIRERPFWSEFRSFDRSQFSRARFFGQKWTLR